MIDVLQDIEGITTDWTTSLLRSAGILSSGDLDALDVSAIGAGQVADCARVAWTSGDSGGTLVVKAPSRDETSRATAQAQRLYEREVRCYQHLLPRTTMSVPACFGATLDPETGAFALAFEDVAPSADVDQLSGFTVSHAEVAVEELAALHGAFWGDETLFDLDYVGGVADMLRPVYGELVPILVDQFITTLGDRLSPEAEAVVRWLQPRMGEFFARPDGPTTLQHGDYRTDNMLFDACGGDRPLVVVDFQTISVGAPCLDLAYLLGTSLEPEDRRRAEGDLVARYVEGLRRAGVGGLDEQWIDQSYRRYAFQGVAMLTAASMLVERTERGDEMFLTMIERSATMVDDLDARSTLS